LAVAEGGGGGEHYGFAGGEAGENGDAVTSGGARFHEAELGASVGADDEDAFHLAESGEGGGRDEQSGGFAGRPEDADELARAGGGGGGEGEFGETRARAGIGGGGELDEVGGDRRGVRGELDRYCGVEGNGGERFRDLDLGAKVIGSLDDEEGVPGAARSPELTNFWVIMPANGAVMRV